MMNPEPKVQAAKSMDGWNGEKACNNAERSISFTSLTQILDSIVLMDETESKSENLSSQMVRIDLVDAIAFINWLSSTAKSHIVFHCEAKDDSGTESTRLSFGKATDDDDAKLVILFIAAWSRLFEKKQQPLLAVSRARELV